MRFEFATPVATSCHREAGLEFGFAIDFEADRLWRLAAALAGVGGTGIPISAFSTRFCFDS